MKKSIKELTEQIESAAKKLMTIAITGENADEELVRKTQNDTDANIKELAEILGKGWADTVPQKPVENSFKIQSGSVHRIIAEEKKDMLIGCINRMCTTDNSEEFKNMVNSAYHCVNALTQLALEKIGVITIPEFKWECKLNLDKKKKPKCR